MGCGADVPASCAFVAIVDLALSDLAWFCGCY